MRYISISHVKEDDIVARDIMDAKGRLLVSRGAALNAKLLDRLNSMGF